MDYNNKALNPSSTACNLKLEVRNCGKQGNIYGVKKSESKTKPVNKTIYR